MLLHFSTAHRNQNCHNMQNGIHVRQKKKRFKSSKSMFLCFLQLSKKIQFLHKFLPSHYFATRPPLFRGFLLSEDGGLDSKSSSLMNKSFFAIAAKFYPLLHKFIVVSPFFAIKSQLNLFLPRSCNNTNTIPI